MNSKIMRTKSKLSLFSIINMSIGFMGIQFGWGLQMANMSAIYEYLGANPDQIPILWLAAPLTGLLVQPIIGKMSDGTWTRLGRRRPYFLVGAVLATIALLGMPFSGTLIMAAGLLWILDGSVNISMEPFRAFVADKLPEEQHTLGYSFQTIFISLGAVTASSFPWMLKNLWGMSDKVDSGFTQKYWIFADHLPETIKYSFLVGAGVMIICVLYTVLTTKEDAPENLDEIIKAKAEKSNDCMIKILLVFFKEIIIGIGEMPGTMRKLAWVQFFTWIGLFLMWIYFGVTVGHILGDPKDPNTKVLYQEGIEWAGLCFACYNLSSLVYSLLMPSIAKKITRKWTHIISLLIGAVSLLAILIPWSMGGVEVETLKTLTMVMMVGVGIAWGSILTMPYSILASSIPVSKMGFYMGVFNFFITLPQIVASLFFGWIMLHVFGNDTAFGVAAGAIFWLIAAIMMLRIKEKVGGTAY